MNGLQPQVCGLRGDGLIVHDVDCPHGSLKLDVHHIDGNPRNNNPENLMWMHHGCHMNPVWTGKKHTRKTIAKMVESRRRRPPASPETRHKISENKKKEAMLRTRDKRGRFVKEEGGITSDKNSHS